MNNDELRTVLVTSTNMLTENDVNALLTRRYDDPGNPIYCAPHECGVWLYAHDDPGLYDTYRDYGYSEALIRLLEYVREKYGDEAPDHRIYWINLDRDAEPIKGLPIEDW